MAYNYLQFVAQALYAMLCAACVFPIARRFGRVQAMVVFVVMAFGEPVAYKMLAGG